MNEEENKLQIIQWQLPNLTCYPACGSSSGILLSFVSSLQHHLYISKWCPSYNSIPDHVERGSKSSEHLMSLTMTMTARANLDRMAKSGVEIGARFHVAMTMGRRHEQQQSHLPQHRLCALLSFFLLPHFLATYILHSLPHILSRHKLLSLHARGPQRPLIDTSHTFSICAILD